MDGEAARLLLLFISFLDVRFGNQWTKPDKIPRFILKDLKKFNEFSKDRQEFSHGAFGSPVAHPYTKVLLKLKKEVTELCENPDDEMEWSDVFLLILDAAERKGYLVDDLVGFASAKLAINKARGWIKEEDGTWRHVVWQSAFILSSITSSQIFFSKTIGWL